MQRTFHVNVGWWYWLLIVASSALLLYCFWMHYVGLTLLLATVVVFEIEMLIHTRYIITEEGVLKIETGRFVPKTEIDICKIISMRKVRSMKLISPALSFNRVEITFRTRKGNVFAVEVSPQNLSDFVNVLRKRNEEMQTDI